MPLCAICLQREADQTGSHMLSAFIIESTVGERGKEKAYLIDDEPNFDYRNNTGATPVVEDYLFCRGCEQRMSYIEGYICREYRDKIKTKRFAQGFRDIHLHEQQDFIREAKNVEPLVFILLIATLLFRISLSSSKLFREFELRPDEQERLRVLINEALPAYENFKVKIKNNKYISELNQKPELFEGLYYIICTYDHLENPTEGYNLAHPEFRLPYNIMLGQIIVFFFFEKPRAGARYLDYFKVLDNHDITAITNAPGDKIKTLIIAEEKWKAILERERNKLVEQKIPGLMKKFVADFIRDHNRNPTNDDWLNYVKENFPEE